ncbi:MAG: DNA mismatch repair endonuclease MutL [Bacteroidaceae bacterium]
MSDIIQLLPDSVANQIAAGEVIQRPGSVIKELVENSLDAGATKIDVLVVDAGKTSIQVVDNGNGMSITDARMSFERHATSKIKEASDLFTLTTMGFRGEALASIAAVSYVDLKTRTADEEMGIHIQVQGSEIVVQEPIACDVGTNFTVKNLFFNVPARRKFLKSDSTELSCITQEYERIVLVNPEVSFSLRSNGVMVSELPKQTERQRIIAIFGKRTNEDLLSLHSDTTLASIHGFVAQPKNSRKRRVHQYFFVNGRFMRHPYFHNAVNHAYENLIPKGEHISYFIYFDVNPESIDVNIHPTKTEIKFSEERSIWQLLSASIRESLGKFNAVPSIDFDTKDRPEIPTFTKSTPVNTPHVIVDTHYNPFADNAIGNNAVGTWGSGISDSITPLNSSIPSSDRSIGSARILSSKIGAAKKETNIQDGSEKESNKTTILGSKLNNLVRSDSQESIAIDETYITENKAATDYIPHFPDITTRESDLQSNKEIQKVSSANLRNSNNKIDDKFKGMQESASLPDTHLLASSINIESLADSDGVVINNDVESKQSSLLADQGETTVHLQDSKYLRLRAGYIVVSMDNELVLIDQHRAHVRVLYDRYLRQMTQHHSVSMGVLFPEILEIPQSDVTLLDQIIPDLEYIGFDLASLGGGSYSINGIPPTLELSKAVDLIKQAIYEATETGKNIQTGRQESLAFTFARNTAIHRNKRIDADEISLLVKQLFQSASPMLTPSGKKIIISLKQSDIISMFD